MGYTVPREAFGQHGVTWVDRFGVFLSQRALRRYWPTREGLDILELGCGYQAKLLTTLCGEHGKVVGVDFHIAPELKANSRFLFIESAIEQALPTFPTASFDTVLLISVLEHLWQPGEALKQCHRILKPQGVLFVNVPTWWGKVLLEFSAFTLGTSPTSEMDDHKMYYDKRDLWPLLVAAGFRPSRMRLKYHKFRLNLFACAWKDDPLSVTPDSSTHGSH